jgi:hypothetical protein
MNDTTRELGSALGVAVLGSVAASRFASALEPVTSDLPPHLRARANSSLVGSLEVAARLPGAAGRVLTHAADQAFVDGLHLSVTVGAVLAFVAAVAVWCHLPAHLPAEGPLRGPLESMEEAAELGIAGIPTVFPTGASRAVDGQAAVARPPDRPVRRSL